MLLVESKMSHVLHPKRRFGIAAAAGRIAGQAIHSLQITELEVSPEVQQRGRVVGDVDDA